VGKHALDIGASTGGFTDCLLQGGAVSVCAVDAGGGQLVERLVTDPRVTSLEHTNARDLSLEMIGGARVDLIVMDVSFISATYILPRFSELLEPAGEAVVLIKPQFEVGRAFLGKGGVVRDPAAHRAAIDRVFDAARTAGQTPIGLIPSPIEGGDGNREFLVRLVNSASDARELTPEAITRVIRK
jgi:23S rRNA (cytidine1920-2'-O)/16S rRNA (cytidine1409-2'-O)-methyltransferase